MLFWQKRTMVKYFAPSKLNLCLHVIGQRSDGRHLLDSLVMMLDYGDWIVAKMANSLSLRLSGPFSEKISNDESNLVVKAAQFLCESAGAELSLEKNIPVSAGIGGGSSDAAATLRALSEMWNVPLPSNQTLSLLGADVAVSMSEGLTRMRGIGEKLTPLYPKPCFNFLLVNPGVELLTPKVFSTLYKKDNDPISGDIPVTDSLQPWIDYLLSQRNDLEQPAIDLQPVVGDVLSSLRKASQVKLVRMSGSGATCFGLFPTWSAALSAESLFREEHPSWWVQAARTWYPNSN